MNTTKKTSKKEGKKKTSANPDNIRQAYISYVLEHGKRPGSVFKFCQSIGIKEDAFYSFYGSFKGLEKSIWAEYSEATFGRLRNDSNYASFTAREKVLAFYFTLVEVLKVERSFVVAQLREWRLHTLPQPFLRKFKKAFDEWANEVIEEGKQKEEIAKRPYLDKQYGALLWFHLHFILRFWSHDDSPDFEKTDEAIEKSVNLAFDMVGKGVLDNAFDFGKFLFQQAKN